MRTCHCGSGKFSHPRYDDLARFIANTCEDCHETDDTMQLFRAAGAGIGGDDDEEAWEPEDQSEGDLDCERDA